MRKLMLDQVLDVVKRVKNGEKASDLAREYKVSQTTISRILSGTLYNRITGVIKK